MITWKMIIKQVGDGPVAIAMTADQAGATKDELRAAKLMDEAFKAAGELMLKGKDIMAEGEGVQEYVKRFIKSNL